ncbi:hypothetical protein FACS189468_0720 [Spirochaetia bacterium]|nr:hypothetical protein FACS189468_0720 [Spirochaetia bacterium]
MSHETASYPASGGGGPLGRGKGCIYTAGMPLRRCCTVLLGEGLVGISGLKLAPFGVPGLNGHHLRLDFLYRPGNASGGGGFLLNDNHLPPLAVIRRGPVFSAPGSFTGSNAGNFALIPCMLDELYLRFLGIV